jgi:hypothetical protein
LTESHWAGSPTTSCLSEDSDTARFPGSLDPLGTIAGLAYQSTDLAATSDGNHFATVATKRYFSGPNTGLSDTARTDSSTGASC